MRNAVLIGALLVSQSWGQEKPDTGRQLADLALAAPPELAADALIKLAEGPAAGSKEQRIEWLERAFTLAAQAKFPMRLMGAAMGVPTDSDIGTVMTALSPGLDTQSLQSRVVRAMLPLDRAKAMTLFRSVPALDLPIRSCQDTMVVEPAAYYDMVEAVYRLGFTAEERAEGRDIDLLRSAITRMRSPMEIFPASKIFLQEALFPALSESYVNALGQISSDDRSFTTSGASVLRVMEEAIKSASAAQVSSYPFLTAWRAFIVRHMHGTRCANNVNARIPTLVSSTAQTFDGGAQQFNSALASLGDTSGNLRPIMPEEITASKVIEGKPAFMYWQTSVSQKMLDDLRHLRFGTPEQQAANNQKPRRQDGMAQYLTDEQRSTPEWEAEVRKYLKSLEDWRAHHDEDSAAFFHMSAINYSALTELMPPGVLRTTVLRNYLAFLTQSEMRKESPPEWFTYVNRLVQTPRQQTDDDKIWFREELRATGDSVFIVYLNLREMASPSR